MSTYICTSMYTYNTCIYINKYIIFIFIYIYITHIYKLIYIGGRLYTVPEIVHVIEKSLNKKWTLMETTNEE